MSRRIYPTIAEAIETHRLLIDEFGGAHGLRDRGLLESAILRPQTGYYSSAVEEAAALMESLANNHPFFDGNKRIAFVMADALLRVNGFFIDVEPQSASQFIFGALAKNEFQFASIVAWLNKHVKPVEAGE